MLTGDIRLSATARSWRVAVVIVLTALFCAGSLVGDDPWWPFGPWRMFSTSTKPTGTVWSTGIEVRTSAAPDTWEPASLSPSSVGLNRAEVEGRIPQIVANPSRLGTLAMSHQRLRPHAPAWLGVRVVRSELVIVNRKPTGEVNRTVLAEWEHP